MRQNSQATPMNENRTFVDAQVHIHACFRQHKFFDAACVNFAAQAYEHDLTQFGGVLLLVESQGNDWFSWLTKMADEGEAIRNGSWEAWTIHRTKEQCSLILRSSRGDDLVVIAGRQIITKGQVIVSALLTETVFPDGGKLATTVDAIRKSGGLPMVLWGASKWSGEQGKKLSEFLQSQKPEEIFLGDHGSRHTFLPYPEPFLQAEQQGIRILPGSDPLPLRADYVRPGSAGFSIAAELCQDTPAEDLKRFLQDSTVKTIPYYAPETLLRFTKNFLARRKLENGGRAQHAATRSRQYGPVRARS